MLFPWAEGHLVVAIGTARLFLHLFCVAVEPEAPVRATAHQASDASAAGDGHADVEAADHGDVVDVPVHGAAPTNGELGQSRLVGEGANAAILAPYAKVRGASRHAESPRLAWVELRRAHADMGDHWTHLLEVAVVGDGEGGSVGAAREGSSEQQQEDEPDRGGAGSSSSHGYDL